MQSIAEAALFQLTKICFVAYVYTWQTCRNILAEVPAVIDMVVRRIGGVHYELQ